MRDASPTDADVSWMVDDGSVKVRVGGKDAHDFVVFTSPKFNIAPEKWWLEDYFPFGMAYFQGRAVKLPGGIKYCLCRELP